jgi:ATP-dependent RNA helicase MSS116
LQPPSILVFQHFSLLFLSQKTQKTGRVKPPTNSDFPQPERKKKNNKKKRNNKNKKKEGEVQIPAKRNRDEDSEKPEELEAQPKKVLTEAEKKYRSQVFTDSLFTDVKGLSEPTLRAVKRFDFQTMTRIQALAIPAALSGKDVLIRAKTGHGKTLAFGIPLFESLMGVRDAQGLVVAPTRELALQTKQVFEKLASEHGRRLTCFIGGTNMKGETRSLNHERVDVLIATPGRLLDHLKTSPNMLSKLSFLILDEADRLLDEGFQRDMEAIFKLLPAKRRTILASATLPANLNQYKHLCLNEDHVSVSAIDEGADAMNAQLEESAMVVTIENWLPVLFNILKTNIQQGLKTILFLQAAQETRLIAYVLGKSPELGSVFEIHSRLSQSQRIKQLGLFKGAKGGSILCSSDVGARGWDIDGVDMVVQLGIPSDNDTYVHRVGRTARAGTAGIAVCLVFDWEKNHFLRRFPRAKGLMKDTIVPQLSDVEGVQTMLKNTQLKQDSFEQVCRQGYSAFLGYHNSMRSKHKISPPECVAIINRWIQSLGVAQPPALEAKTVGKMGLKGVAGLNVVGKSNSGRNYNNNNNNNNNNNRR